MEKEGESHVWSLPRSFMKHRLRPWVTHLLRLCQPHCLYFFFLSVFFCLRLSLLFFASRLSVCVTLPTHTHTQPIFNNSPTHTSTFSLTQHEMTFRSYTRNNTPSISPVFHLLLARPLLSVHLLVKYRRRDRERQMIALKGKTTQFHNFPSALSSRLRQFNQHLWSSATREMRYREFDVWYLVDWLVDLLHLKPIDYLTSWVIDWLIKCVIAWPAWRLTDKRWYQA